MQQHVDLLLADLAYYYDLTPEHRQSLDYEIRVSLQLLQEYNNVATLNKEEELIKQINDEFNNYYESYLEERR